MKKALLVLFAMGWFLCCFAQEIKFETVVHDFGEVFHNAPAVYDFVFTNTGTEPLIVQKPKSSCGCLVPSWPKDPIMPGAKEKVTLTYNTNRTGNINKSVTVLSNATNSPSIVLRVKGKVLETEIKMLQKNGKWGCEDGNGNVIIPFQYEQLEVNKIGFNARKNGKWGVIDMSNNVILPFEYDLVKVGNNSSHDINIMKNDKWGIANKAGLVVIPCKYDKEFNLEGRMVVKQGGKSGVIDKTGKVLMPFEYDEISFISGDDYSVKLNNKWGLISQTNKIIVPFEYDEEFSFRAFETIVVKKNGKYGLLDKTIGVVVPFEYDEISSAPGEYDKAMTKGTPIRAKKNGKWGLIDKTNKNMVPFEYDAMESFNDKGEAIALKNGKWGVIDKSNRIIIPFDYDDLTYTGGEVICAKKNGKWGLINKQNKALTNFFAELIIYNPEDFKTLCIFEWPKNSEPKEFAGKLGAISTNGNMLIPPICGNMLSIMGLATQNEYDKKDCNQLIPKEEIEKNFAGAKVANEVIEKLLK